MANKEKIDYLLIDIRELEKLVAGNEGRGKFIPPLSSTRPSS